MRKKHFFILLISALLIAWTGWAMANPGGFPRSRPDGMMKQGGKAELGIFSKLELSTEQTEEIRKLRVAHEKALAPLHVKEQELKAELRVLWLQLTPDMKKIKSVQKEIHDIKFQRLEQKTSFKIATRAVLTEDQLSRLLAFGTDCHDRHKGPRKLHRHGNRAHGGSDGLPN